MYFSFNQSYSDQFSSISYVLCSSQHSDRNIQEESWTHVPFHPTCSEPHHHIMIFTFLKIFLTHPHRNSQRCILIQFFIKLHDILFIHTFSETSDRKSHSVSPSVDRVLTSSAVYMYYNLLVSSIYSMSNPRDGDLVIHPSSDQVLSSHRNFTSSRMFSLSFAYWKREYCNSPSVNHLLTWF